MIFNELPVDQQDLIRKFLGGIIATSSMNEELPAHPTIKPLSHEELLEKYDILKNFPRFNSSGPVNTLKRIFEIFKTSVFKGHLKSLRRSIGNSEWTLINHTSFLSAYGLIDLKKELVTQHKTRWFLEMRINEKGLELLKDCYGIVE